MKFLPQILLVFLFFSLSVFAADDWRPVTQAELDMKIPKVDPGADAEAIFWEVRLDDRSNELTRINYVRVKIFTERGREMFAKYEIPYLKGSSVKDIEARVIKPDGTIVLLKKEDIFEKEILKADGIKIKAKSFAMPGIEVGAILEYRYREENDYGLLSTHLIFQREIPVQTISYYVRPMRGKAAMYAQPFNTGNAWFEDDKNGYKRVTMTNQPAFRREPSMLPENEVRAWMFLYYSTAENITKPDEYWRNLSRGWYDLSKSWLKTNDAVKDATATVIAGAATDDEKLKKIYEFVQGQIKNLRYTAGATPEDWKLVAGEKTTVDTLRLKMATPAQVNYLFAAMAVAAGYDARAAYTGNRNEIFTTRKITNVRLMLTAGMIAVKVGDKWRFFDPANAYAPYGMLSWVIENQVTMVTDPNDPIWVGTPLSPPEKSAARRSGTFKLLPDGTLEGQARVEFTGHMAYFYKSAHRQQTAEELEKLLKNYIHNAVFSTAEVENIQTASLDDGEKSFIFTCRIKVPNYALKTGKRLFFQPGVFERNSKPRFTASNRWSDVYFTYPWMEQDDLTIDLPAGFSLENADAPAVVADRAGIGKDQVSMEVSRDGKLLTYKRKFTFGNGGAIRFGAEIYPAIKDLFESFYRADTHQMTLKEGS